MVMALEIMLIRMMIMTAWQMGLMLSLDATETIDTDSDGIGNTMIMTMILMVYYIIQIHSL